MMGDTWKSTADAGMSAFCRAATFSTSHSATATTNPLLLESIPQRPNLLLALKCLTALMRLHTMRHGFDVFDHVFAHNSEKVVAGAKPLV